MTKELTDERLTAIFYDPGARAIFGRLRSIIAADRELQAARHDEELAAYEVTVSNLRGRTDTHAIASGAIYDFMGWLTTRDERLVLSGNDEASPAAEAVAAFLTMRGVSKACEPAIANWSVDSAAPAPEPERKPAPSQYGSPEIQAMILANLTAQPERKPMPETIARHLAIMALPYSVRDYGLDLVRAVEAYYGIVPPEDK